VKIPDIVRAAFGAVVKRVVEMAPLSGLVVATGGVVAHDAIVIDLLAEAFGATVETPPYPQFSGALGAALYAADGCE